MVQSASISMMLLEISLTCHMTQSSMYALPWNEALSPSFVSVVFGHVRMIVTRFESELDYKQALFRSSNSQFGQRSEYYAIMYIGMNLCVLLAWPTTDLVIHYTINWQHEKKVLTITNLRFKPDKLVTGLIWFRDDNSCIFMIVQPMWS